MLNLCFPSAVDTRSYFSSPLFSCETRQTLSDNYKEANMERISYEEIKVPHPQVISTLIISLRPLNPFLSHGAFLLNIFFSVMADISRVSLLHYSPSAAVPDGLGFFQTPLFLERAIHQTSAMYEFTSLLASLSLVFFVAFQDTGLILNAAFKLPCMKTLHSFLSRHLRNL